MAVPEGKAQESEESEGLPMNMIIIIVACVAGIGFVVVIAIVTVFLCHRRDNIQNRGSYKSPVKPVKGGGTAKDVPPDLWIHQPAPMELQRMDKGRRSESSVSVATSTLPRASNASTERLDDLPPPHVGGGDSERKRNSYVGSGDQSGYPSSGEERYQPVQPRNIIRPKPITLPVDGQGPPREPVATVTALPNGHILGYGDGGMGQGGPVGMRPVYPRTQYNTQYTGAQPPRVHAGDIPHSTQNKGAMTTSESEDGDDRAGVIDGTDDGYVSRIGYGPRSPEPPPSYGQVAGAGESSQHALGRGGRGFNLPCSSPEGAPTTPTPRHVGRVKPQPNLSPYKKPSPPVSSGPVKTRSPLPFTSKAPDVTQHSKNEQDMTKSLSTEELSAEMANLEGLMKDLNAITQQEFEC